MKKTRTFIKWSLWTLLGVVIAFTIHYFDDIAIHFLPEQKSVKDSYVYSKNADSLLVKAMLKAGRDMGFELVAMSPYDELKRRDKKLLSQLYYSRTTLNDDNPMAIYWKEKRRFGKIKLAALMVKKPTVEEIDQSLLGDESMVLYRTEVIARRENSWNLLNIKLEEFENRVARLAKEDDFYFEGWGTIFLQGHR